MLDWMLSEWRSSRGAINHTWKPFIGLLLASAGVVWLVVDWSYSTRTSSTKSEVKLLETQIGTLKTQLEAARQEVSKNASPHVAEIPKVTGASSNEPGAGIVLDLAGERSGESAAKIQGTTLARYLICKGRVFDRPGYRYEVSLDYARSRLPLNVENGDFDWIIPLADVEVGNHTLFVTEVQVSSGKDVNVFTFPFVWN